jgi:hypothetical protein
MSTGRVYNHRRSSAQGRQQLSRRKIKKKRKGMEVANKDYKCCTYIKSWRLMQSVGASKG